MEDNKPAAIIFTTIFLTSIINSIYFSFLNIKGLIDVSCMLWIWGIPIAISVIYSFCIAVVGIIFVGMAIIDSIKYVIKRCKG